MKRSTSFRYVRGLQDFLVYFMLPFVAVDQCMLEPDLPWWEQYKWPICLMIYYVLGLNSADLQNSSDNWRRNELEDAMKAGVAAAESKNR